MWPHGSHAITTRIESRRRTWSANTSAGEVCTPESRCCSNAATVESWRGAGATTRKTPNTAAPAKVAAATRTAAARTC
jgi:hypothetical protein